MENYSGEVCSNCGSTFGEGQDFCPKCGTLKNATQRNACGKCGAELQDGQEFCHKCGQKAGFFVDAGVQKKNKKKVILAIILGAVAILIACTVALIMILKAFAVEEIVLSQASLELEVGETTSVNYTIVPDTASGADVTWKSSNAVVASVTKYGEITGNGDGSCTITVTAGDRTDSLTVTVKSGPDFKGLYNDFCQYTWADYGADGSFLSIDTNPYDLEDDEELSFFSGALNAIADVNDALGLPSYLYNDMIETRGIDGKQVETFGDITVTWKYHPDSGLEVTYKESVQ